MKLITSIFLTVLLTFSVNLFEWLPWYSFAITTFIIFIAIPQPTFRSFSIGFCTVVLFWAILVIKKDFDNEHILSKKVAIVFQLKNNYWMLYIATALIGGFVAGLAALSGSLLRNIFAKKRRIY